MLAASDVNAPFGMRMTTDGMCSNESGMDNRRTFMATPADDRGKSIPDLSMVKRPKWMGPWLGCCTGTLFRLDPGENSVCFGKIALEGVREDTVERGVYHGVRSRTSAQMINPNR